MWPVDNMRIITAKPLEAASPKRLTEPSVFWLTMAVAVAANIRMNVPMNSVTTFTVQTMQQIIDIDVANKFLQQWPKM